MKCTTNFQNPMEVRMKAQQLYLDLCFLIILGDVRRELVTPVSPLCTGDRYSCYFLLSWFHANPDELCWSLLEGCICSGSGCTTGEMTEWNVGRCVEQKV